MNTVDINKEIDTICKPHSINFEYGYPIEKLTNRAFELLTYQIFKEMSSEYAFFDQIQLMQGVSERGRDSILYFNSKVVGIIQNKHSQNISKKYSLNELGIEIVKFVLHYLQDNTLIENTSSFKYYFVCNTDVDEKAQTLFLTAYEFLKAHKNILRKWVSANLKKYKKLTLKNDDNLNANVLKVIRSIEIIKVNGVDLNNLIKRNEKNIVPLFFEVKIVSDNSYIEIIQDILTKQIEPKLEKIIQLQQNKNLKKESYIVGITRYLHSAVENFTFVRTIIFGNNRQKLDDLYVPLTLISKKDQSQYIIPSNFKKLLKENKKILISSTAGMGKSTLAKKIFLEIINSKYGFPIFIELRRLTDRITVVREILNRLKPLYGNIEPKGLFSMIEQGDFIFIFDGFDEIEDRHKSDVIHKLNDFISKSRDNNFIITSRPETALNSFANFQEFSIQDLNEDEAFQVLRNYGKDLEYAEELINRIQNDDFLSISEFLKNPLLVSLLYKAYEFKRKIPIKKHLFYTQVYYALYENHDLTKEGYERNKRSKLDINKFETVLRYIAYKTAIVRKLEYTYIELEELLQKSHSYLGFTFSISEFIKDLTSSVPLFTAEGNYYNWSHKSLQDYFAARFIQMDCAEKQSDILNRIYNSRHCDRFDNILDILYEIDIKTFRNTIIYWLSQEYQQFINENYNSFGNVEEDKVNSRRTIMFKRRLYVQLEDYGDEIPIVKLRHKEKPPNYFYYEGMYKIVISQKQMEILSFTHPQHFFLQFLARKNHRLVLRGYDYNRDIQLNIKDFSIESFEVTDSKDLSVNKDKIIFENFTNYLLTKFGLRINHDYCLSEKERIEVEVKMKEEDDLLQFE
ncbi:NACHT domain-containing protein [Maribellus sediminis]|uniref:NACHT domain-containing protein n=1 Tax=Maribellus sediminis TaxID=2696285 RepID=UPI001430EA48|nr:NACHT domain-containing protein [Maribellus sediminis]